MVRLSLTVLLLALGWSAPVLAVSTDNVSGGYQTTVPTVTNWNSGWSTAGATGWDYVGQVGGGASGVYLGNGWVLTAGHVGAGDFTLAGTTYSEVAGSQQNISDSNGQADLALFQISTSPALNGLSLSLTAPVAMSSSQAGSQVVMIGYGGGAGETWGANTVNFTNQKITPGGYSYVSNDFLTVYGTFTNGTATSVNHSNLVGGDSGGGDFIYDPVTHSWILAGINEVNGTATINSQDYQISGFVQLNTYASEIQSITGVTVVPEPRTSALFALGFVVLLGLLRRRFAR